MELSQFAFQFLVNVLSTTNKSNGCQSITMSIHGLFSSGNNFFIIYNWGREGKNGSSGVRRVVWGLTG